MEFRDVLKQVCRYRIVIMIRYWKDSSYSAGYIQFHQEDALCY